MGRAARRSSIRRPCREAGVISGESGAKDRDPRDPGEGRSNRSLPGDYKARSSRRAGGGGSSPSEDKANVESGVPEVTGRQRRFQIGGRRGTAGGDDRRGVENLLGNQFEIGGEASATAGPVGRDASASTDVQLRAQMLSYSRSRGLFAGVSLKGAALRQDQDSNQTFYGSRFRTRDIVLDGKATQPQSPTRCRSPRRPAGHGSRLGLGTGDWGSDWTGLAL